MVDRNEIKNELIEHAKLIFRNFRGAERTDKQGHIVNQEGKRNFCVVLNETQAEDLLEKGWNVKRSEWEGQVQYTLQVAVSFKGRPPKILQRAKDEQRGVILDENTVGQLDFGTIEYADLIIRAYPWEVNGISGVKAYLRSMEVIMYVDPIEARMASYEEEMPWG